MTRRPNAVQEPSGPLPSSAGAGPQSSAPSAPGAARLEDNLRGLKGSLEELLGALASVQTGMRELERTGGSPAACRRVRLALSRATARQRELRALLA